MTAARADDALDLAQALVAVPSVSGNEAAVVETIRGVLASWGLAPVVSGRNVWCRVEGNRPGRTLLLQSHIDTVPTSSEWKRDPWKAERDGGRLFGLGSNDTKGGGAAMMIAVRDLAASRDFAGTLLYAATCDEETGGQGLEALRPELPPISGAVIAEPTVLRVAAAQRGLMRIVVRVEGRAAHAARPWQGVNAIELAMDELAHVRAFAATATREHAILGRATCTPTLIEGGTKANVVPSLAKFTLDVRPTPEYPNAWWAEGVPKALRRGEVELLRGRMTPVATDPADPLVRAALAATAGDAPVAFGGVSDLFHVRDVPGVVLGPGNPEVSHTADEWVDEAQVVRAVGVYRDLAREYLR
ncbi:MAG: M20/M25/M40 family metallo-hydrolase [Planctomycetes bacterium]|nr:M20/M25/M40 family metallo-hydrolase [Planctomycetota bacterium]